MLVVWEDCTTFVGLKMNKVSIISLFSQLRVFFGVVLTLGLFAGQVAAFALPPMQEQDTEWSEAAQEAGDHDKDSEEVPVLKAPEATVMSSPVLLPQVALPAYTVSVEPSVVVYPLFTTIALGSSHHYRTLFRQIISPNAP